MKRNSQKLCRKTYKVVGSNITISNHHYTPDDATPSALVTDMLMSAAIGAVAAIGAMTTSTAPAVIASSLHTASPVSAFLRNDLPDASSKYSWVNWSTQITSEEGQIQQSTI